MKTLIKTSISSATLLLALTGFIAIPNTAYAQSSPINISASLDYASEYVFRGVSFSNTAVQPGLSVSAGNFTVGVWGSVAVGETSALAGDEIDIYGSYSWSLSDKITASVGATIYHFPQSGDLFDFDSTTLASTIEGSFGLSVNTVLSPNVTAYYDATLDAFTLTGSVSQSYPIANKTTLNVGVTGGLVAAGNGNTDYEWATANANLNYAVTGKSSIYAGVNFTVNSEDFLDFPTFNDQTPSDNLFWAGVGFSTGF
ncbi:MAG: TorF family putative porin [Litorimonas sp.]